MTYDEFQAAVMLRLTESTKCFINEPNTPSTRALLVAKVRDKLNTLRAEGIIEEVPDLYVIVSRDDPSSMRFVSLDQLRNLFATREIDNWICDEKDPNGY